MKTLIGHIGIDSGQVLICDPCYIDSEWESEEFTDDRIYQHKDGTILKLREDFPRFDRVIPKYDKDMNALIKDNEVTELPPIPAEKEFSYNACCKKTLSEDRYGQLNYRWGYPGVGVVSSTAFGDGYYPVYADKDKYGTIKRLIIEF